MGTKIGAFEEIILLAVGGQYGCAYAVTVQQRIETIGNREAAMGAVYAALERLERKGYLKSKLGPVTNRPGGKKKRFYQITGSGYGALAKARETRQALQSMIDFDLKPEMGGSM